MDLGRKERSDSVLGRLPVEKQSAILKKLKAASLEQVSAELGAEGVKAPPQMLSRWRRVHERRNGALREQFGEAVSGMNEVVEFFAHPFPQFDGGMFLMFANEAACIKAFREENWGELARMQRLHQKERMIELDERRVKLEHYKEEVRFINFEGQVGMEKDRTEAVIGMLRDRDKEWQERQKEELRIKKEEEERRRQEEAGTKEEGETSNSEHRTPNIEVGKGERH